MELSYLAAEFLNQIELEKNLEVFFKNSSNDLLGPALRRANCFFGNENAFVCILEKWGAYFVLGDVFFTGMLDKKQESIQREALYQNLFDTARENRKRILGYYLERPILSGNFKSYPLGLVHRLSLSKDYLRGRSGNEIRRAKNLAKRQENWEIQELRAKDLKPEEIHFLKTIYRSFVVRQLIPYISYLLAKTSDPIASNERVFLIQKKGKAKVSAMLSGFRVGDLFYVDRLAKLTDSRMSLDMLLAGVFERLHGQGVKRLSLGLSPFFAEEKNWFWPIFRRVIRFWYDSESLRIFKNKYSSEESQAYFFVEKRKSLFWNFLLLSFVSVYWRLGDKD